MRYRRESKWGFLVLGVIVVLTVLPGVVYGQGTFKNGGTYTNSGTMSANTFENYKPGNPGTLDNTGTVNVSSTFDNNQASAVVNNAAGGTINVTGAASTYNNGAGATNNSTATSKISLVNTLTLGAGGFDTQLGEVEYASGGAQTVVSGVTANTYGKLSIAGGAGTKSLGGNIVVSNQVDLGAGTTFDVAGQQLMLNGATPFANTGTFSAAAANSEVIYNAVGAQSVRGASYYKLTVQNGGTKTAVGDVTIVGSGTLTNTVTLDMSTFTLTADAAGITLTNTGGTIRTQGAVALNTTTPPTIAGTFIYENSTTSQSIGAASYANLTLSGGAGATGQKSFPSATVSVSGMYSVGGANRDYGSGTFAYNSTTAQTVLSGESYNNLTIANAIDTSVANYKTAGGSLYVAGALAINSGNTLDMGSNTFTTLGSGSNSGKIRWAASNVVVAGSGMTEFYSSNAGTVAAGTYGNLWFTGSGVKTIAGVVTASGGADATFGVTIANNLTVSGTLTVTSMDLNNDGTLTNSGTITVN